MATIIPAILVDTQSDYEQRIAALPEDVTTISIDIMDGTFVEPTTYASADTMAAIDRELLFELDLMVNDPLPYIESWAKIPTTTRAIIHAEIDDDPRAILERIHDLGLEAGLALLPETDPQDIEHLLNTVDMILIRGNEPGYSGRAFNPDMYEKIRWLNQEYPELMVNVDIGVNADTIPQLVEAGATHLSVNSAIFKQEDPAAAYHQLQHLAEG